MDELEEWVAEFERENNVAIPTADPLAHQREEEARLAAEKEAAEEAERIRLEMVEKEEEAKRAAEEAEVERKRLEEQARQAEVEAAAAEVERLRLEEEVRKAEEARLAAEN